MLQRFHAWLERRSRAAEEKSFEDGRRWAHHEIIFGRGYRFAERHIYGAWCAFDRGALEALREHALEQEMLGREVREDLSTRRHSRVGAT